MIRVGGATETEVKERKDRVDDALHATRAAARCPAAAWAGWTTNTLAVDAKNEARDCPGPFVFLPAAFSCNPDTVWVQ